ncbi:non-structural maintenance of chromosomes element 1 homolog [Cucumis sativus]|uniref:non-structural maintenance of chromosomes element 1 homolog n=1 Tax=Cucumis sativus TaxID=3659 RepID=UPI0012F48201|nr:non-structural maintenance of chromosomes element 1 homolog [Cucumis sativus]XP_031740712.1 non-structural maintenance of chromosomes element 1 homolog [Cucumis sativus]
MPELSWRHHTLIQSLLSRGPLREDQFHLLFKQITGKTPDNDQQVFNSYLLTINKALSFAQFELRGCRNQYDGRVYYGLVNNVSDDQSKLGTKYSVPQIALFKAIVEAIAQDSSAQGGISNISALNLQLENQAFDLPNFTIVGKVEKRTSKRSSPLLLYQSGGYRIPVPSHMPAAFKNFSKSHKEKTIAELAQDKWLDCTPDGFVNLGVRSFLDLRSWFRSNDVPSCEVCNEAGVKAELCSTEVCTVRVHQYCLKKMLSNKKSKKACPGCGTRWQSTTSNIEPKEEEDEPDTRTQDQPSSHKRKKSRLNVDIDLGPNEDSTAEASQPPPTRRTTRSSARQR